MYGIEGDVEEEGLCDLRLEICLCATFDECHGLSAERPGQVLVLCVDRLAVAHEHALGVFFYKVLAGAIVEAEPFVEPAIVRLDACVLALVPLADYPRLVPQRLQSLGHVLLAERRADEHVLPLPKRTGVIFESETVLVTPRHQPRPRRSANRSRDVTATERDAVPGDRIDMRCGDLGATLVADVPVAEIVGKEDDDVRLTLRNLGQGWLGCLGNGGQQ